MLPVARHAAVGFGRIPNTRGPAPPTTSIWLNIVTDRNWRLKSPQLHREPFGNEPDLYFYFTYEAFEQRLETLRRLLQSGESLTLIIGDRGSGKTTLLQRYLTSSSGSWKVYRLRVPGNSTRSKPEIHPAYLLRQPDMRMVLDDAQRLGQRSLQRLVQEALVGAGGKPMRLVLCGEPKIEKTVVATVRAIDAEQAVNRIYMPRLAPEECAEYLRHRLTMAGYSGPAPFGRGDFRKLHRSTGGLPGRINSEARAILQKRWGHLGPGKFNLIRKLASGIGLACLVAALLVPAGLPGFQHQSAARIKATERHEPITDRTFSPGPQTGRRTAHHSEKTPAIAVR